MSSLDELKERFLQFRKKKYALALGLIIAVLLSSVLTYFVRTICFAHLLIAIIGFYIPYYFGLKNRVKLAVWGLAFIFILAVPFTWVTVIGDVNSYDGHALESTDGLLVNGHITPYRGDLGTTHTFNVTVTDGASRDYSVNVIIIDQFTLEEFNHTMVRSGAVPGGVNYTFSTNEFGDSLYIYQFQTDATGDWVSTDLSYGPVHQSNSDIFIYFFPIMALSLLIQVGMLYYLLLLFSWFSDRSRKRAEQIMKEREETKRGGKSLESGREAFVCSECGADVPAHAGRCPQCGESFEEDVAPAAKGREEGQFECSECGASVDEDAKRCWNCNKEFEN